MSIGFVNGKFVDIEKPSFSAQDRALLYGDGFFESIKYSKGRVLHFNLHYARIEMSLKLLKLQAEEDWTRESMHGLVKEVCDRNKYTNARIRIVFYRETEGTYLPHNNKVNFFITAMPIEESQYPFKAIANLDIYKQLYKTSNFTSILKTTSANIYVLASIFAKEENHDDCLLVNEQEHICEATSSNIFIVKNNKIITPPLSEYCVNGVMRKVVLQLAEAYGYECQESLIEEQDLYLAHEVFLTNALNGIMPVKDFRGREYSFAHTDILIKMLNESILA